MANSPRVYETEGPTGFNFFGFLGHILGSKGSTGFSSASTAEEVAATWDGKGKVAVVTGASAGLGKESSRVLASRGCEVILACRSVTKGQEAADEIKARHPEAKLSVMELDLASLESVKKFSTAFKKTGKRLNILLCNAGVMACPYDLSSDDHEMQFATNHLGHFFLTKLLMGTLIESAKQSKQRSRVVVVSSVAHYMTYGKGAGGPIRLESMNQKENYHYWSAYGQSKLCNILFTRELHKRGPQEHILAVTLHPGAVVTELQRHLNPSNSFLLSAGRLAVRPFFKTIPQGAATQVLLATAEGVKGGEYYTDCNISASSAAAHDAELGEKLWELSERMVAAYE